MKIFEGFYFIELVNNLKIFGYIGFGLLVKILFYEQKFLMPTLEVLFEANFLIFRHISSHKICKK